METLSVLLAILMIGYGIYIFTLILVRAFQEARRFFRELIYVLWHARHFSFSRPGQPVPVVENEPAAAEAEKPPFTSTVMVVKMPGYAELGLPECFEILAADKRRRLGQKLRLFEEQQELAGLFFAPIVQHAPDLVLKIDAKQAARVLNVLEAISYWKDTRAIRTPESWSPKPLAGIGPYLENLVHHLFARYEVPPFIQNFWSNWKQWPVVEEVTGPNNDDAAADPRLGSIFFALYFHMADGGSLRKADFLPFRLSRRADKFYRNAPLYLHPLKAFWWATFMAFGGALEGWQKITRLEFNLVRQDFWKQFLMLVIRQPNHRDPDFSFNIIRLIKFGEGELARYSSYQPLARIHPEFSLKGQTLGSIEAYFIRLMMVESLRYPAPLPLAEAYELEGSDNESYRIVWLKGCKDMVEESEEMFHCLGDLNRNYHTEALEGYRSFWSLRRLKPDGSEKRLLTFELDYDSITQISGPHNQEPEAPHLEIIQKWAGDLELAA